MGYLGKAFGFSCGIGIRESGLRCQIRAHMLCWGIGGEHVGIECLQVLQATELLVELIVRQGGGIHYIVAMISLLQFASQSDNLLTFGVLYL